MMGIRNLFRPKWKHSDPAVREAAVEELADQAELAQVAKTDPDASVRIAAANRLRDPELLAEIAKTDREPAVREAAAEKMGAGKKG